MPRIDCLRTAPLAGGLACLLFTTVLPAQARTGATLVWLDAGGARLQQPTGPHRAAGTVGGGLWYGRGTVAVAGEGSLTVARDSVNAAQYVVRTSLTPVAWSRTDLDVSATTNGLIVPGRNGNQAVQLRHTFSVGAFELSGTGGTGRTSRAAFTGRGHAYGVGAERQHAQTSGTWRGGVTLQRSVTTDYALMEASGITLGRPAPHYTLTDAVAQLSWQRGRWWLQANRGWRRGNGATTGSATGVNLALAVSLSASSTLIVQGGEQLADVVRGVPQARYTGLALRWNPVRPRTLRRDARALADVRGSAGAGVVTVPDVAGDEVLLQRREGQGVLIVTINAPGNAVVELADSHGGWTPVTMTRELNAFVHRLTLPSGAHKVAVRINGGDWRAPRGLAPVNDELGGKAGVVIIP